MAIPYLQWLAATGKAGTAADAMQWKTTHGVVLGKYNPDGTPKLPAAPAIPNVQTNPATAPVQAALQDQMNAIPGVYDPMRAAAQAKFNAAILPYGTKDKPGPLVGKVTRDVRQQHASRGSLYSSFADKDIGAAVGRLSDQARAIYDQYADQLTDIANRERSERNTIGTQIAQLVGADSAWALENPPAPPAAVTPPKPAASGNKRPDGLFTAAGFAAWLRGTGRPVPTGSKFRDLYWGYLAKHGKGPA